MVDLIGSTPHGHHVDRKTCRIMDRIKLDIAPIGCSVAICGPPRHRQVRGGVMDRDTLRQTAHINHLQNEDRIVATAAFFLTIHRLIQASRSSLARERCTDL